MERTGKDLDHFIQEALREAGLKEGEEVRETLEKLLVVFFIFVDFYYFRWTPLPTSTLSV